MKVIVSKYIPFHGFRALALYNLIIWRKEYSYQMKTPYIFNRVVNHEAIHEAQMRDFCKWLPIGGTIFYIIYALEWLFKVLFMYPFSKKAYYNISFEKEARLNEANLDYLNTRIKFSQFNKK